MEREKKRKRRRERETHEVVTEANKNSAFGRAEFGQWRKFKIRSASRSITFPLRPTFSTPLLHRGDQSVVFGKKSATDRSPLHDEGRASYVSSSPLSSSLSSLCCSVYMLFRAHTYYTYARARAHEITGTFESVISAQRARPLLSTIMAGSRGPSTNQKMSVREPCFRPDYVAL